MSDGTKEIADDLWNLPEVGYADTWDAIKLAHKLGRASMLAELRAKWPSEMEIMDEVYKATRDTGFCYSDLAVWLKEKIFGGVDDQP
jgi:hypothetical protein